MLSRYEQRPRSSIYSVLRAGHRIGGSLIRKVAGAPAVRWASSAKSGRTALAAASAIPMAFAAQKAASALKNVTTTQNDFTASGGNSFYASRRKFKKRKLRRARRKLNRIIKKHYTACFWFNIGRSYASAFDSSCCVLIPILSYRGTSGVTASSASGGTASQANWFGDMYVGIKDHFVDQIFVPSTASANKLVNNWWFKINKATLDLTMSNTGVSATDNTGNAAEYEIYRITGKKMPREEAVLMDTVDLWEQEADDYQQGIGNEVVAATDGILSSNSGYVPYGNLGVSRYVRSKLIGRGQIPVGSSVRFNYSYKPSRGFCSREQWFSHSSTDTFGRPIWAGKTCHLLIVFRGMPSTGQLVGGYPKTRMTFNCNWRIYAKTQSTGQELEYANKRLIADSFA